MMAQRMSEAARKDLLAGVITINEYLDLVGKPLLPPEKGDVCLEPEGFVTIGSDDFAELLREHGIVDLDETE